MIENLVPEYLEYLSQDDATYGGLFFGDTVSDEIEMYNWEER